MEFPAKKGGIFSENPMASQNTAEPRRAIGGWAWRSGIRNIYYIYYMRISEFIANNAEPIISEWEDFARTCPASPGMDRRELRNNIGGLLRFIVEDLERPRTEDGQTLKTQQGGPARGSAESHADQRFARGFDTLEMISEFRALRASIIKLWLRQAGAVTMAELRDLVHFNEAIDELLTGSLARYMEKERHARSLFLGTLIHDIRNPLNTILQSAQLLEMFVGEDERKGRLFTQIQRSAMRIGELVAQLIDTVRVRLGKPLPLSRTPMDIAETAALAVEELQSVNPKRKILLSAPGQIVGEWDGVRIGQIISNLVANALRHGRVDSPVTVSVTGNPDEAIISVHNEGRPISPDNLATIFDPLTRGLAKAQEDPDRMSLGLGLFITRQIVLAHGGSIGVESSAGKGTTFTARLPRLAPPAEDEIRGAFPPDTGGRDRDLHNSH